MQASQQRTQREIYVVRGGGQYINIYVSVLHVQGRVGPDSNLHKQTVTTVVGFIPVVKLAGRESVTRLRKAEQGCSSVAALY